MAIVNGHSSEFRQYLPDLSQPRYQKAALQDAHSYAETFEKNKILHGFTD
jgi:hypothetical protein